MNATGTTTARPSTARRIRNLALRLGLGLGWLATAGFYGLVISRTTGVEVMYTRYEPLLQRIFVHDCLTALVLVYWAYLIARVHRVESPLLPFVVFFAHAVAEPFLLMGDQVVFLWFRRLGAFWLGYPLALGVTTIWLVAWSIQNRARLLSRARGAGGDRLP